MFVDNNFINLYDIKILAGRNFDNDIITDISSWEKTENGAFILNAAAVKEFGWNDAQEALGKEIITGLGSRKLKVIGVVEDFHYMGLQNKIEPMILEFFPSQFGTLSLTVNGNDYDRALEFAKNKWDELYPEKPFQYYFLDDDLNKYYEEETKAGKLVILFTILAIFIACLGLYGLSLFSVEKRVKEIGIRKVLGATIMGIVKTTSFDFIKLVFIANIVTWPFVYYFMDQWLHTFEYRIDMPIWTYLGAWLASLTIAQLTISIQAYLAASRNPVLSLRHE